MAKSDQQLAAGYEGCFAAGVRLIDRVVSSAYDDALRPLGVRATQVALLGAIASAEHPTAARLSAMLVIEQSTLSRNIARLTDLGLVQAWEGQDRRTAELELTDKGRKILRDALPHWKEAQAVIADRLGTPLADAILESCRLLQAQAAQSNDLPEAIPGEPS